MLSGGRSSPDLSSKSQSSPDSRGTWDSPTARSVAKSIQNFNFLCTGKLVCGEVEGGRRWKEVEGRVDGAVKGGKERGWR